MTQNEEDKKKLRQKYLQKRTKEYFTLENLVRELKFMLLEMQLRTRVQYQKTKASIMFKLKDPRSLGLLEISTEQSSLRRSE